MTFGIQRVLAPTLLAAGLLLMPARANAAGGAFAVDDAEISDPGECKVESWGSFAGNRDMVVAVSPACVVKFGVPVDLSGQLQRSRSDGVWGTSGTLKAKVNLIPTANRPFGLGLAGGSTWDLISGANTGGFVNLPATLQLHDSFSVNLNSGWLYDGAAKIHYLTWGAGFEWKFVKPLTLIGEVFGQTGRLPEVDAGDPPSSNTIREPRIQLGLRLTPQDKIDIDLVWGRNITGENAHWLTLGLNLRF